MKRQTRVYPACCTSAYCGKGTDSCPKCPNYAQQQEFYQWVKDHNAKQSDPIWCPTVYVAQT